MTNLVAGGHVDGGSAVVGGEAVLGGKPVDVTDLSEDAPGDHRPDPEQVDQGRSARLDELGYLRTDSLDLAVEGADVTDMAHRQLPTDPTHGVFGPQADEHRRC